MKTSKGGEVIPTQPEELCHLRITYSGTALFAEAPEDLHSKVREMVSDMLEEKGMEIAPDILGEDSFRLGFGRPDYTGWSCFGREQKVKNES